MSFFDKFNYLCSTLSIIKNVISMNEVLVKKLKWLSVAALFICVCWLMHQCVQGYNYAFGSEEPHIHWETEDTVVYVATIFSVYFLLTVGLIVLCSTFFINTLKGIRRGEIFPKSNIFVIYCAAFLIFLQTTAAANFRQTLASEDSCAIVFTTDSIVQCLSVLIFGIMYQIAYQVATEHDLTV